MKVRRDREGAVHAILASPRCRQVYKTRSRRSDSYARRHSMQRGVHDHRNHARGTPIVRFWEADAVTPATRVVPPRLDAARAPCAPRRGNPRRLMLSWVLPGPAAAARCLVARIF